MAEIDTAVYSHEAQTFNSCIKCMGSPGKYTTVRPIATQSPGHGCMDDLTTKRRFDSGVCPTGAGNEYLYCISLSMGIICNNCGEYMNFSQYHFQYKNKNMQRNAQFQLI